MTRPRVLAGIMLLAVALRLASALLLGDTVTILPGIDDQISYHNLAIRVLQGHGFSFATDWWPATRAGEPTAHWSFLYTLYLTGVYLFFGIHPIVARLIQAVAAGILQPWLAWRLGSRVFSPRVGLIGAALTAIYLYFVYYAGALMTETFYIIAILWILDLVTALGVRRERLYRGIREDWRSWVWLGLAVGAATLLRQLILFLLPVVFIWLIVVRRQDIVAGATGIFSRYLGPTLTGLLIVVGIVAAMIAPWTARNYAAFHRFELLNTNSGYVFFWANNPIYGTTFVPILPDSVYYALIPVNLLPLDEAALDQALLQRGIQFVVDDPKRYALLSVSRVATYFEFWPSADSGLASNVARSLSFGVLLPFILCGLILAGRRWKTSSVRQRQMLVLLYAFIVVYTTIHLLSWALIRYRLPVDAIFVLFAARAMDRPVAWLVARWRTDGIGGGRSPDKRVTSEQGDQRLVEVAKSSGTSASAS